MIGRGELWQLVFETISNVCVCCIFGHFVWLKFPSTFGRHVVSALICYWFWCHRCINFWLAAWLAVKVALMAMVYMLNSESVYRGSINVTTTSTAIISLFICQWRRTYTLLFTFQSKCDDICDSNKWINTNGTGITLWYPKGTHLGTPDIYRLTLILAWHNDPPPPTELQIWF